MEMSSVQIVPAPPDRVWTALNDPQLLKSCITGCETIERVADNEYKVAMSVKVGPVNAKFAGKIFMADLNPPQSYTLNFEGQGGMAGHAKGTAKVSLSPDGEATKLAYTASAQIGGKLAQIGSRLVDGAANKMAADFFAALARELEEHPQAPDAQPSGSLAAAPEGIVPEPPSAQPSTPPPPASNATG